MCPIKCPANGILQPAQLIADAQRSGVEVRPVDINYSAWDSTLELVPQARHALRLGLRLVKGLNAVEAARITACRRRVISLLRILLLGQISLQRQLS